MTPLDPPDDALLVQLYSCFSEHTRCAGWLMDPWQPHVKREFTDWLQRYVFQQASERPLEDYERAALETLRECWAEARAEAASADTAKAQPSTDLPIQSR